MSTRPAWISASSCCRAGRSIVAPESPPSSYPSDRHTQPSLPLAFDAGLTSFALRLQRIELLLEPLLGRLAGVDRATDFSAPPRPVSSFPTYRRAPLRIANGRFASSRQRTEGPTSARR